mmetsp:Transcript_22302/g.41802  ORF Transcript_22302/g.41802 Transcript_22302/m.41802 type:complete len:468 (+) Transcript_22302:27-1430(+)
MPWVAANNRHSTQDQVHLRVIDADGFSVSDGELSADLVPSRVASRQHTALVNPASFATGGSDEVQRDEQGEVQGVVMVFARTHAQFVAKARFCEKVPVGAIVLDEAQRLNFEVALGTETFPWSVHQKDERGLAQAVFEIKPRKKDQTLVVKRESLATAISKALWGMIVTVHERILLDVDGCEFSLRVKQVRVEIDEEEEENMVTADDDDHRGTMETTTKVFFDADMSYEGQFELEGEEPAREAPLQSNMIDIICNDEEWFPVKKRLLQPCIALAKYVLSSSSERETVHIDTDCCSFDKVLRYLEAENKGENFKFELHETDQLLAAASVLRLTGLKRLCDEAIGNYRSSIREEIPWEEVKARNSAGEMLLLIDDCVCNVTDWLEHHPGGNTIIPEQALNCDATVLFELYHASRESFLFLKQLYIGKLRTKDRHLVPPPHHESGKETPSDTFLAQLREFLGQIKQFKSF